MSCKTWRHFLSAQVLWECSKLKRSVITIGVVCVKCIDWQFNTVRRLVGTCIETYLPEKGPHRSSIGWGRHLSHFLRINRRWGLDSGTSPSIGPVRDPTTGKLYETFDFNLVNGSGTNTRRDGVSDKETYRQLSKAMHSFGFAQEEQKAVLATATDFVTCFQYTIYSNSKPAKIGNMSN